ncbi:hypothetical protein T310_8669, partial [Rasamsonia emersonii CBS 393.64]
GGMGGDPTQQVQETFGKYKIVSPSSLHALCQHCMTGPLIQYADDVQSTLSSPGHRRRDLRRASSIAGFKRCCRLLGPSYHSEMSIFWFQRE